MAQLEIVPLNATPLKLWLAAAPLQFAGALRRATEIGVKIRAEALRADTPVLTGELAGSYQARVENEPDGFRGVVFTTVSYGRYQEFGTRYMRARRMFGRSGEETKHEVEAGYRGEIGALVETFSLGSA